MFLAKNMRTDIRSLAHRKIADKKSSFVISRTRTRRLEQTCPGDSKKLISLPRNWYTVQAQAGEKKPAGGSAMRRSGVLIFAQNLERLKSRDSYFHQWR